MQSGHDRENDKGQPSVKKRTFQIYLDPTTNDSVKLIIQIGDHHPDKIGETNLVSVIYKAPSPFGMDIGRKVCDALRDGATMRRRYKDICVKWACGYIKLPATNEHNKLEGFLEIIDKYIPLDKNIKEIYLFIGNPWLLAKVQEEGLIEENPQALYELYAQVPQTDPHYQQAQSKLFELLQTQIPSTQEEKYLLLGEKMRTALESNTEQRTIDSLYSELCGYVMSPYPAINNVKPDCATLLKVAEEMRLLREENSKLKLDISKLNIVNAALDRAQRTNNPTSQSNQLLPYEKAQQVLKERRAAKGKAEADKTARRREAGRKFDFWRRKTKSNTETQQTVTQQTVTINPAVLTKLK